MSKAFTKNDGESDNLNDDLLDNEGADESTGPLIPKGSKNYITQKGMEALKSELHALVIVERPRVVETVAWAASNGDRSENADYQYGKKRLREIDRRTRFLQKRIDMAEVVDPATQKGNKVLFGATVHVVDEEGANRIYRIVGIDETDAKAGKVSWISPIGQALLQAKEGDVVTLKMPKGEEELEVERVQFIEIE